MLSCEQATRLTSERQERSLTLRENTERPITIEQGTNRLVHVTTEDILKHYREIMESYIV